MDRLFEYMQRLLHETPDTFHRYLYEKINWSNRMLGIVGPRGVGKTTLLLQRILEAHSIKDTLYVSLDHLYFANHSLFDTADSFVKQGGRYLFVDEVHKYPEWSKELKTTYDVFPDLHIYFTGSSILEIEKGEADLSRRAPKYILQGLSFREYLAMRHDIVFNPFSLQQVLDNEALIPEVKHPLVYFKTYLKDGYYPFGVDEDFDIELGQVITRTLEVDIPQYAGMNTSTGRKLMKLMAVISTVAPFKPNMTSLGSKIQVSRNNVEDYLGYLEKAGMIARLKTEVDGLAALGKVEKIYLDNTNILFNISGANPDIGTVRETFFFNQSRVGHLVTASPVADFTINGITFEVGGKNKGKDQIRDVDQAFIVKDNIEYGSGNVIPLWAFGLMY